LLSRILHDVKEARPARKLFFDKFYVKASIDVVNCNLLRRPRTEKSLIAAIKSRNDNIDTTPLHLTWLNRTKISNSDREDLIITLAWLTTNNIKYSIEYETITMFANDLALLEDFFMLPGSSNKKLQYAHKVEGEIACKRTTKYNYRMYFNRGEVSSNTKSAILSYLDTNNARLSPSAKRALKRTYGLLTASHFVDYTDESLITMLAIIAPTVVGKQYKLVNTG